MGSQLADKDPSAVRKSRWTNVDGDRCPSQCQQDGNELGLEGASDNWVSLFADVNIQGLSGTSKLQLGVYPYTEYSPLTIQSSRRLDRETARIVISGILRSQDVTR